MRKKQIIIITAIILIFCLWSVLLPILRPEYRTGPLGFGLPAKMKNFTSESFGFSIQHPESWIAVELLNGNHGDQDVIGWINVPGRSWPSLSIARHDFADENLEAVINWGASRIEKAGGDTGQPVSMIQTSSLSGKRTTYTFQSTSTLLGKRTIFCQCSFFWKNGEGYMITFCSEQDDWKELADLANNMVESLSFP